MEKIIAANWKMFLTPAQSLRWAYDFLEKMGDVRLPSNRQVIIFPDFTALYPLGQIFSDTFCLLGAQDCSAALSGPYTGQVSAQTLGSLGCAYVLIGHSERRHGLGETNALIARKIAAALTQNLKVMLCVGETLKEREEGKVKEVLTVQLAESLSLEELPQAGNIVVAYEPVWAIGTGRTAGEMEIFEAHRMIRGALATLWGSEANVIPILYGGSVKPANAASLLRLENVDGLLVGGASLDPDEFMRIVLA